MADRDVILAALLDWRLSEAPLYLRAQLGPHDLARLTEVAARAVAEAPTAAGVRPVTMYAAVCGGCGKQWQSGEYLAWSDVDGAIAAAQEYSDWRKQGDGRMLCGDCLLNEEDEEDEEDEDEAETVPPPVGTPDEAQACARRSGIGEVG